MKATWKRWLVLFVAGAAVGLLCHLTAKENLVELGLAYDLGRTDVRIKVGPSRIDWEDVAPAILDNTHMPWPIPCEMPVRRVDLKAQSLDAEALMGLALLVPWRRRRR